LGLGQIGLGTGQIGLNSAQFKDARAQLAADPKQQRQG
jgi:hypothetical protein